MTIQEFINQYINHTNVGDTDKNRGQCVGLVEVWLDTIGAPHIWGNACDLANNADRNAYVVTPNTPTYVPQPGDIGVLPAGWEGSAVGHTFIVAPGTTVERLVAFEQNDRLGGGDGACRLFAGIGWPDGLVFIHPKVLDPAPVSEPVPTPDPAPTPEPVQTPEAPSTVPSTDVPSDTLPVIPAAPDASAPQVPAETDPVVSSQPHNTPTPTISTTTPIVSVEREIIMVSKFLSRKFLVTVLGIIVALGAAVQGAISTGESLTSISFLVAVYTAVQGAIDHKGMPNG